MLYGEKSKEELDKFAEKLFKTNENVRDAKKRRILFTDILKKYNIPIRVIDDMITFKRDIKEFTPFQIFAVVWFLDRNKLSKFFTDSEIENFSNYREIIDKESFPVVFDDMVQISDDQWIGKITMRQLMLMKRSQMINYDENEQRALKRVRMGNEEIFKPFVNAKSVAEIKDLMERGAYIPDPITLNMPEGSEFEYKYNRHTKKNELIVYSLPRGMFNLDDGYHRYLAMSQIFDFNESFDYVMELRVVNFSNSKALQFIFQQDQKTQMRKIVSDSYDMGSVPNRIVQKLNEDPQCNIQGMIGRNKAQINSGVLAKTIAYFYKTNIIKGNPTKFIIETEREIRDKFNVITDQNTRFLDDIYSEELIIIIIFTFTSDIDTDKYADFITSVYDSLTKEDLKIFRISARNSIKKRTVDYLNNKAVDWR